MAYEEVGPVQYIIVAFMLLITFYLTFLYIKTKDFHTYACYNIIIMSIMIFVGSIIIMIPNDLGNETTQFCIGIFENFSYKIVMTILTIQIFVLYLGIIKTEFYYKNEKKIFIVGIIISVGVSLIISIINCVIKTYDGEYHEYLNDFKELEKLSEDSNAKTRFYAIIIIEMVFNAAVLVINIICLIKVMIYLSKKKQDANEGLIEDLGYKDYLKRFILIFVVNIIAIASSSIFLVFDIFDSTTTNQSIYLAICLLIDIIYSFNKTVYNETLKIFCCKSEKDIKQGNKQVELKKRTTFNEDEEKGNEEEDY